LHGAFVSVGIQKIIRNIFFADGLEFQQWLGIAHGVGIWWNPPVVSGKYDFHAVIFARSIMANNAARRGSIGRES
jgi:hypothetical protein